LQEISDESQSPNWSLLETQVTKMFKRIPDYNTVLGLFILKTRYWKQDIRIIMFLQYSFQHVKLFQIYI